MSPSRGFEALCIRETPGNCGLWVALSALSASCIAVFRGISAFLGFEACRRTCFRDPLHNLCIDSQTDLQKRRELCINRTKLGPAYARRIISLALAPHPHRTRRSELHVLHAMRQAKPRWRPVLQVLRTPASRGALTLSGSRPATGTRAHAGDAACPCACARLQQVQARRQQEDRSRRHRRRRLRHRDLRPGLWGCRPPVS